MLAALDRYRSLILSRTLRFGWIRHWYRSREGRIQALFILALAFNFLLLGFNAKILFYLSPLLLGVPHLFASFVYSSPDQAQVSRKGVFTYLGLTALLCGWTLIRLKWMEMDPSSLSVPLSIFASALVLRQGRGWEMGRTRLFLLTALSLPFFFWFPRETSLVLLLGHNFIAFVYWYRSAKGADAKNTVLRCLALTTAVLFFPLATDALKECSEILLGSSGTIECALMYAFLLTQGLHYFIWLKAIPDFKSTSATPGGFRFSVNRLKLRLGNHSVGLMLVTMIALTVWALSFGLEEFRLIYVALASYHGLYEIAALVSGNRK